MYILRKNINYPFLANRDTSADLKPVVLGIKTERNPSGKDKQVLELEFYCRVDKKSLKKSNCKKIDVRISRFDTSYYRNLAKLTQSKVAIANIEKNKESENESVNDDIKGKLNLNRKQKRKRRNKRKKDRRQEKFNRRQKRRSGENKSRFRGGSKNRDKNKFGRKKKNLRTKQFSGKGALNPSSLTATARSSAKFRLNKNSDIYRAAKKLSSINFPNISTNTLSPQRRRSPFGSSLVERPEKSLRIKRNRRPRVRPNLRNIARYDLRTFKKQYQGLIEQNIDPMHLFESGYEKVSLGEKIRGVSSKSKNTNSNLAKPVINELQRKIKDISTSRYEFETVSEVSKYKILKCKGTISIDALKRLGENIYIIFVAKDRAGINLQVQSLPIKTSDIIAQTKKQSTSVKAKATRRQTGVCSLLVSNLQKNNLELNLEVKEINRQDNFLNTKFTTLLEGQDVAPLKNLKVVDGAVNSTSRKATRFKKSESVMFRTTFNYRNNKYFNATSAYSPGIIKNENIPTLNIIAKIDEQGRGMIIDVTDISKNVAAVKVRKYKYTGSSKGKLLDTYDLEGEINRFTRFQDADNSRLTFFDTRVDEDRVYMYVAECIMKNSEKKLASDFFIEKFELRTGTVRIDDLNVVAPSFVSDASAARKNNTEASRKVTLTFNVSKIETKADLVVKNLFGNIFNLFQNQLKQIKDTSSLIYSIEIQRIEKQTGNSATVGIVSPDEDGNVTFVDREAPAIPDLIYKIIPRVMPPDETISSVQAQIPFLAKKNRRSPANFAGAARRARAKNVKNKVFGSKQNIGNRASFKRGLIIQPKDIVNRSAEDIFADNSTGDISYIDVDGISTSNFFDRIGLSRGSISEIRHATRNPESLVSSKNLDKKYYELKFQTNNDFLVDFYVIFVKEGNSVYLDGTMHSSDVFLESKTYRYFVEHSGSAGIVEYYVVPFLKSGNILNPVLAAAQLIE